MTAKRRPQQGNLYAKPRQGISSEAGQYRGLLSHARGDQEKIRRWLKTWARIDESIRKAAHDAHIRAVT